jgi:transcriptional regulator with XRE-family HTH domain
MKSSDIIKDIRSRLNLSQTELADKLGVSFATVNRWEKGHRTPSQIALGNIKRLCADNKIDYTQFEGNSIISSDEVVTLYHGSKSGIVGDIAPSSREHCDFGKGFYMGTTPEQPLTLICDFEEAKFYVVSVDTKALTTIEIPADIDWAMVVAYHRGRMERIKDSKFYKKYSEMTTDKDLAIGSIANDRMFFVIDNFFQENITDIALINSLSALQLGKQYVALTEKACKAIKVEKEIEFTYFEKKILQKVSEGNRRKGIDLANEICKSHRREGKFFDEILDEALKGDD